MSIGNGSVNWEAMGSDEIAGALIGDYIVLRRTRRFEIKTIVGGFFVSFLILPLPIYLYFLYGLWRRRPRLLIGERGFAELIDIEGKNIGPVLCRSYRYPAIAEP